MAEQTLVLSQIVAGAAFAAFPAMAIALAVRRSGRAALPAAAVGLLLAGTLCGTLGIAQVWSGAAWFIAFPLLMASYPDGRLVPRWAILPVVLWLGLGIAYAATGSAIADSPWWLPVVLLTQPPLLGLQVYRYRRRLSTAEREQVRWAILGVIVELSCFSALQAITGGIAQDGEMSVVWANLAGWPLPLALAIGLMRPRLVRVDPLLHAAVIAIGCTALLAACFTGAGWLAQLLGADAKAAVWWAAAAVAAAVVPVGDGMKRVANWTVYGGRSSPGTAARSLAQRLETLSPADDIAGAVIDEVMAAVRSPAVRLDPGEGTRSGSPTGGSASEGFPVVFQGEHLATLQVAPRAAETALTRGDLEVVVILAAQAAPALHGARALVELAEARSSLLLAREEERKRLRRDLHDDLAPTLAGLGMSASAIIELADQEQTELLDVAVELRDGVDDAIAQTRRLAYGLRPAILDDRGLVDAVRERAHVLVNAGIDVTVSAQVAGGLPAAVEVAALLIAQEAMTNVMKHSSATQCSIAIKSGTGGLDLCIDDNGIGLQAVEAPGVGFDSMRERAAELGGQTSISVLPTGGTRVHTRLGAP